MATPFNPSFPPPPPPNPNTTYSYPYPYPHYGAVPNQVLLETLIPGFPLLSAIFSTVGINLSSYLSHLIVLAAVVLGLSYVKGSVSSLASEYLMSSAEIRQHDEMYTYVMTWIANHSFGKGTRRFVVGTKMDSFWWIYNDDNEEGSDDDFDDCVVEGDPRIGSKRKPLQYTPSEGSHFFRYKGRWLLFTRVSEDNQGSSMHRERVYLSCLGRNPAVLKRLLDEAQAEYLGRDNGKTVIYRAVRTPSSADSEWTRCMSRPNRPLSTVVLDQRQRDAVVKDIAEYYAPASRRWYSNRGIPYRRGYIFYGPPGTGKSSLCFALAGYFGLKIYVLNLNAKSLTEDGLAALFQTLPKRCIVLLEDIDTAGLTTAKRVEDTTSGADNDNNDKKEDEQLKGDGKKTDDAATKAPEPSPGISLSALLNVLDGVASSEGRVLVMTTNHIDKLDKALLRPGRVDMKIEFSNADTATVRDLFCSIYSPIDGEVVPGVNVTATAAAATGEGKAGGLQQAPGEGLVALAERFAGIVPGGQFSPAEVQGYLLKHKYSAQEAVEGAQDWVKERIREKKTSKDEGDEARMDG